jgi:uncharacterized protein (DUF427 family)
MSADHPITIEASKARVRVTFNGKTLAESARPLLLREHNHAPVYYLPRADVRMDLLKPTAHHTICPYKGEASYWSIEVDGKSADNAVWSYEQPIGEVSEIASYLAFYPGKVDVLEVKA